MGLCLGEKGIAKTIYGFHSFEGIDAVSFAADLPLGGAQNEVRHRHGIRAARLALVASKVKRFFLTSTRFVPGYLKVSFLGFDPAVRVCFAYLDVNLYEPFRDSLNSAIPGWCRRNQGSDATADLAFGSHQTRSLAKSPLRPATS